MTRRGPSPVWLVLIAIVSVQVGAAFAKGLFGQVSPVGMAWLRLSAAALILTLLRPSFKGLTRRDWVTGLGLAACLVGMNWAIYESFARIPLGLAVTIEFLGPLSLALLGCRRVRDLIWVVLAAAGVAILGFGPTSHDLAGIGFAFAAATCWAGYIWFGAKVSASWRGVSALTLACWLGVVTLGVPAVWTSGSALVQPHVIGAALAIGLLSSVVPYSLELKALQTIPPKVFGILMALEPVAAALAGIVLLREMIGWMDWVAIACVVVASVGVVRLSRPQPMAPAPGD